MEKEKKTTILSVVIFIIVLVVILTTCTGKKKTNSYSSGSKSGGSYNSSSSGSFTNKYGTPTTKCAHKGCNNYIASSGDTNCCTVHSRRCGECGKYIDEDALFCIDCLSKGANR